MMKRIFAFFALAWASIGFMLNSQPLAVKTNLLGWATTTMNLGAEIAVAHRHTVQLFGALNPWTFSGGRRVRFWSAQPEWRYWLCERFNGHFFGLHALGGEYNVRNVDMPFGILPHTEKGRHYEGWYVGAGLAARPSATASPSRAQVRLRSSSDRFSAWTRPSQPPAFMVLTNS